MSTGSNNQGRAQRAAPKPPLIAHARPTAIKPRNNSGDENISSFLMLALVTLALTAIALAMLVKHPRQARRYLNAYQPPPARQRISRIDGVTHVVSNPGGERGMN